MTKELFVVEAAAEVTVKRHGAKGLYDLRDAVLAVYADIYKDRLDTPFFALPRYWERLEAYASRDGFSLVAAELNAQLIGFGIGFTLPEGSGWWRRLKGAVDPGLLVENGHRTFAITELMVREQYRRHGYAHAIHDALLYNRIEERATLLVRPENEAAQAAYRSWGWYKLGELQPFDDSPVYDAMVFEHIQKTLG